MLGFHWHPDGEGFVTVPHLHVGAAMIAPEAPVRPRDFHRAHVPTRALALDDVVRFTIAELGVEPLRADWSALLAAAEQRRTGDT